MSSTMPLTSWPASVSGVPSRCTSSRNVLRRVEALVDRVADRVGAQVGRAPEAADDVVQRRAPVGRGRAEVVRPGLRTRSASSSSPPHPAASDEHDRDDAHAGSLGSRELLLLGLSLTMAPAADSPPLRPVLDTNPLRAPASGSRGRSTGRSSSWPCSRPAPTAARSTRGSSTCSWSRPWSSSGPRTCTPTRSRRASRAGSASTAGSSATSPRRESSIVLAAVVPGLVLLLGVLGRLQRLDRRLDRAGRLHAHARRSRACATRVSPPERSGDGRLRRGSTSRSVS